MAAAAKETVQHVVNGLSLEFDPRSLALRSLGCGRARWLDNRPKGEPLWQIHIVNAEGARLTLDGAAARRATARMDGDTLRLRWDGVHHADAKAGPFDVRVDIAPSSSGRNLTGWRLTVENRSGTWSIWHIVFPRLCGLTPGKDAAGDRVFWPELWGVQAVGWDAMTEVSGPCGGYGKHSMQFMGFTRGDRTLYLAAHDPDLWQKQMTFDPGKPDAQPRSAQMHFLCYPAGMGEPGNGYAQPYDTVVGEVAGDWYDASRVYAAFARRQPWATTPPPTADPRPREQREVLVWEQASVNAYPVDRITTVNRLEPKEWVARMKTLRKRLGVRMAVHLYHWHQTQFDTNYPDYFPVKRGLKALVAELESADIRVMPYINGRLWDLSAPSFDATALKHAAKITPQRANPTVRFAWPEHYGNGQQLTGMCMASEFWRKKVVGLCGRIVKELGCGGVYLDQLGCFGGGLCMDPEHGHDLGGGGYWLEGYRKLLAAVRKEVGPGTLLTTENNWEGCVADFDALLDTSWNKDGNVPIFPAVYWGLGSIYGGDVMDAAYRDGGDAFVQRMGMRFVWGGLFGWGHFEPLLERTNRELMAYFTNLCRLRTKHAGLFARGEFLRPPLVTLGRGGAASDHPLQGPVLSGMWADADDERRCGLFLVNVTRKPQRVRVAITDERWRSARMAAGVEGVKPARTQDGRATFNVSLGALDAVAVPLTID